MNDPHHATGEQSVEPQPGDLRDLTPEGMDRAAIVRRHALDTIAYELRRMFVRLADAGFAYHRIGEVKHPVGMIVGSSFAGNEFTVTVRHWPDAPAIDGGSTAVRLTQAVIERDPTAVARLCTIVLRGVRGDRVEVYYDHGGTLLGLESGPALFGQRSPDDPQAPSTPVDEDDGPDDGPV